VVAAAGRSRFKEEGDSRRDPQASTKKRDVAARAVRGHVPAGKPSMGT
jgi:hypothetical protein